MVYTTYKHGGLGDGKHGIVLRPLHQFLLVDDGEKVINMDNIWEHLKFVWPFLTWVFDDFWFPGLDNQV